MKMMFQMDGMLLFGVMSLRYLISFEWIIA